MGKGLVGSIKKHPKKVVVLIVLLFAYYFCLPKDLFKLPTATVVESRDGTLLGAMIAEDGQWRFPKVDSVPYKFEASLLAFEDGYFYHHPGFNPVSMAKAFIANIKAGSAVRGGSTITQQLIRLSRQGKKRSYWEKTIELVLATRIELRFTKQEILEYYASYAPFGGNVVGLNAAAWRYYGLPAHQLSWAESVTLAVLPNAPSLIYPGKNQKALLQKRDKLLRKLFSKGIIDQTTLEVSLIEQLPQKPYPLPSTASHWVQFISKKHRGEKISSTIDVHLQSRVNQIIERHHQNLRQNQIHNAAILVMDVHTREVLAYVGNAKTTKEHQKDVDMVQANRSTGSTIKPLLYTAMLDAGALLPNMLVPDVPTQIAGYSPENFNEEYSGAVTAKKALARSLNIPAVRLLQQYGLEKFKDQLDFFDIKGINRSADHYGLTLILGGAEASLWDLCKTYASMASTLNHFNHTSSEYYTNEFVEPVYIPNRQPDFGEKSIDKTMFDAGSIYLTFEAMKNVNRPEGEESWEFYDGSAKIAWKTGTSFGNKDAWSIGITKDHVIGVWVGNADGEGRPNLTGLKSAAPVLFDVFDVLPSSEWFTEPLDELVEISVCGKSGYLPSENCPLVKIWVPKKNTYVKACTYHQMIHLDEQKQFRINASCYDLSKSVSEPWFVLPPLVQFYYKRSHPTYRSLPPFRGNCNSKPETFMEFIYPNHGSSIALTRNFEGEQNELVVKLAHVKTDAVVYWYLDESYIQQTTTFHEIGIIPSLGFHKITAVDSEGNELAITIEIE